MRHIPLEELGPGIRRLELLCGLQESPLDALSQSPHHSPRPTGGRWPARAADMPLTPERLWSLGGPPAGVFLDATTRSLIGEAFAEDYAAYGRFYARVPVRRRTRGGTGHDLRRRAA